MTTSLNRTAEIDLFISNAMTPEEATLFEAKLIADAELKGDLQHQQTVLRAIRFTGRQHLKEELNALHEKLMRDPERRSFWNNIYQLFN